MNAAYGDSYQGTVNRFTRKAIYDNMVNEQVSSSLVELRKRANVSQKAVAEALGVTDHTIRNWEKGRAEAELQLWQVKALCRVLSCSLDELPDRFKTVYEDR